MDKRNLGGHIWSKVTSHQNNIPVHDPKACIFSTTDSLLIHSHKMCGFWVSLSLVYAMFIFSQTVFYEVSPELSG